MTDAPTTTRPTNGLSGQTSGCNDGVPGQPISVDGKSPGNASASDGLETRAGGGSDDAAAGTTDAAKSIFRSKTLLANAVVLAAALYPPTAAYMTAEPTAAVVAIGLLNLLLRLVTRNRLVLFPDAETSGK